MGFPSGVAFMAIRAFQIIFAAVVLGLAVALLKQQVDGTTAPAILGYAAFTGGIALLAGLIGIASIWVEMLQGLIMGIVDALIAVLCLAGGIAYSVKLKDVSCSVSDTDIFGLLALGFNSLINAGCNSLEGSRACADKPNSFFTERCKKATADSAFQYMLFIILAGSAVLGLLTFRNTKLSMRGKV